VKVKSTEQVPLLSVFPHVLFAMANSAALAPDKVKPEKLKAPPPMVTVSVSPVEPTDTAPKFRLSGVRATSVRHPETLSTCGLRNPPLEKSMAIAP
jgi:hypothetical protein